MTAALNADKPNANLYSIGARIIEISQQNFANVFQVIKDEIGSLGGFIEIEGSYKDDIIRIVSKMEDYKQEGNQKPWMKINDGVRMAVKVKTPLEAFDITKKIMQALLNNTSVIKIDSKLKVPHLRNVTIHGFNFKKGIKNKEKGYMHLVGAEIQVRVDPEPGVVKKEIETLDHSLYEFKRNIEGLNKPEKLKKIRERVVADEAYRRKVANDFFFTLGKLYIKVSKFKKSGH